MTKVIFRKYKDGEIIALFPEEVNGFYISCYMHIGQHSVADYNYVVRETKLATESEYQDLKRELENIGYNLKAYKKVRVQYKFS